VDERTRGETVSDQERIVSREDLDEFSSTPLYQQIASRIRDEITSGSLGVGDRLPTENSLSHELGVGVSTVRSAYAALVREGLVTRRAHKGSFVSSPELGRQLDGLYSFTSETRRLGKEPSSQTVRFETAAPPDKIRGALGMARDERAFEVVRLRLADGRPLMLETSYIPVRICPDLKASDVEGSLYARLTELSGLAPAEAHEVHEAVSLSKEQARLLGRSEGDPAFLITRVTRNVRGETFEYCVSICPGDGTRYEMTLRPDGTNVVKTHA
jgi:GntR family transcriptional regulator